MKVLIAATTYPLPSRSYDELVCTAGFTERGEWIRIYPVPLKFLKGLRKEGKVKSYKYTWLDLELKKRTDDFRPESFSPKDYTFGDLKILAEIGTENKWAERKVICLKKVYTNLNKLKEDSKDPRNVSLATFKPTSIMGLKIIKDISEWKKVWADLRKQNNLFDDIIDIEKTIPKLPYKFSYSFQDDEGNKACLMIEDWEIGALYWNCLKSAKGNESIVLQKVKDQYESKFLIEKDIYLFLGTTKEWHRRRTENPFVIIGVFYPPKNLQGDLFI